MNIGYYNFFLCTELFFVSIIFYVIFWCFARCHRQCAFSRASKWDHEQVRLCVQFFCFANSAGSVVARSATPEATHNMRNTKYIFYFTLSNPKASLRKWKKREEAEKNVKQPFFFRQQNFYVFYNALKTFFSALPRLWPRWGWECEKGETKKKLKNTTSYKY